MRPIYIIFACCIVFFSACSSNNTTTTTSKTTDATATLPPQSNLSDSGTQLLLAVVNDYYTLKETLVAAKAAKADSASKKLAVSATVMQAFLKKDSVHTSLNVYFDTITTETHTISTITDPSCEQQRLPFSKISTSLYAVLKQTALKHAHVYQQHCPMAFNEKGAFWLSDEEEIRNPYFGKKMLECGDVTDSLK